MVSQRLERGRVVELSRQLTDWTLFGQYLNGFPQETINDIHFAFDTASGAHKNKIRISREPYITHPIATALILIDVGIRDYEIICMALMHDVLEDTTYLRTRGQPLDADPYQEIWRKAELDKISRTLTEGIAMGVSDLTQPDERLYRSKAEADREYHFSLESVPSRVLLVKMADRLHNLLTLDSMPEEKQVKKIKETIKLLPIFKRVADDFPKEGGILFNQILRVIAAFET